MSFHATLVIMAAGMGSRFGGLKQAEPVGKNGEAIVDYSVFDAVEAGFDKVVFVIKHAIEDDFKTLVGNRISKMVKVGKRSKTRREFRKFRKEQKLKKKQEKLDKKQKKENKKVKPIGGTNIVKPRKAK